MTRFHTLLFAFLLLAYVASSFGMALYANEPDLVNRMGASLSAAGAVMILFQVTKEIGFETQNQADRTLASQRSLSSLDRSRVEQASVQRAIERHHQRMRIIVCIAIMVFVGEVLAGWGDCILAAKLHVCIKS